MAGCLLVLLDDGMADAVESMPFVSSMLPRATTFRRAWSEVPVCGPSRVTILTGQHPNTHGVLSNGEPQTAYNAETITYQTQIGAWLRAADWRTAMIGKHAAIALQIPGDPAVGGWDRISEWMGNDSQAHYVAQVWDGETQAEVRAWHHTHQAAQVTAHADDGGDWFALWATSTPHWPFAPGPAPTVFSARPAPAQPAQVGTDWPSWITDLPPVVDWRVVAREHRSQWRELHDLDRHLAAVWAHLEDEGQAGTTTVIVTSDNGRHAGDHRLSGGGLKNTLYEPAARIPLVAWGPGFPPGRTVDVPVGLVDVPATIAAIAEATPTHPVDGIDLRAIAATPANYADRMVLLQRREQGDVTMPDADGVISWPHKYVRYADVDETTELYDLAVDPGEATNLAGDAGHASVVAELDQVLDGLLAS